MYYIVIIDLGILVLYQQAQLSYRLMGSDKEMKKVCTVSDIEVEKYIWTIVCTWYAVHEKKPSLCILPNILCKKSQKIVRYSRHVNYVMLIAWRILTALPWVWKMIV